MAEPTVSAGFAQGLVMFAASKGAAPPALLAAARLRPEQLIDADARIPFAAYVALMRAAKSVTGDAALALHFAEAVDIARVSIVGLIGQASPTMIEAFRQLNRYVRLVVEARTAGGADRFVLREERGALWLVDNRADSDDFPELTESAFAQLVCSTRRALGGPPVLAVEVTHPNPGYAAEYERILGAPVTFGAARNAMRLSDGWLETRVEMLPRYVFGVLSDRADALLAELERAGTSRARVEADLMARLHTGEVGMEVVAAAFGLSRQTLFRRLKAEGTSFEKLLDALRHRLALDYLLGRKVTVNEAAYLLGFSDPAAFSRAFKRWTGQSPNAYARR